MSLLVIAAMAGQPLRAVKDPLYRLTRADRTNPGATPPNQWTWNYDAVGNRTSAQKDQEATTSTHNEKNQLLSTSGGGKMLWRGVLDEPGLATFSASQASINGQPARMLAGNVFEATLDLPAGANTVTIQAQDGSGNVASKTYSVTVTGNGATYTYDANGNLAQKVEGGDTWVYTWNAHNRLTKVEKNGTEQARFGYDPLGRRVEKVAAGVARIYAYEGANILREQSGANTMRYVHSFGVDDILAGEDAAGVLTLYHRDGLGSIARATNSAGTPSLERQYDVWGNPVVGASSGGFAFTGREWDPETGLYYYRARYYDPKGARFLAEDPMGLQAGPNLYGYVAGNPASYIDPHGLERLPFTWPPKVPVTPPLPGRFERPTCCNKDEVRDRMNKVIDFITGMSQGQQPAGGVAGDEAKESSCDPITGICTPFVGNPNLFNPSIPDQNPCTRYCGVFHEWVHETDNRRWNLNWTRAAINLYREYPAYLRELICLRSFVMSAGQ